MATDEECRKCWWPDRALELERQLKRLMEFKRAVKHNADNVVRSLTEEDGYKADVQFSLRLAKRLETDIYELEQWFKKK